MVQLGCSQGNYAATKPNSRMHDSHESACLFMNIDSIS
jgi:hypothetical protein